MKKPLLKILDICLSITFILMIFCFAFLTLTSFGTQHAKLATILILVCVEIILGLSVYRQRLARPEARGFNEPLLIPKTISGMGWSINSCNPLGLVLNILLGLLILFIIGKVFLS